jgi:hypothetical protein
MFLGPLPSNGCPVVKRVCFRNVFTQPWPSNGYMRHLIKISRRVIRPIYVSDVWFFTRSTLMTETEEFSEILSFISTLTQLITRVDFNAFICRERSTKPRLTAFKSVALTRRHPLPQKLALTLPTSGGRSFGIVRLRTKGHGVHSF